MQKRGMSIVITYLIVILLVIVAIFIFWVVVKNLLSEKSKDVSISRITADLEIKNVVVEDDKISVATKRNPGLGEITGIRFDFSDGTNNEVYEVQTSMAELEEKTFDFTLDELDINEVVIVSIVPIITTETGKEDVYGLSDYFDVCIPECEGLMCGLDPLCSRICGTCDDLGYICNTEQQCEYNPVEYLKMWNGFVSWWRLDGNADDEMGLNPGTLQGGVDCNIAGKYGNACQFDGNDDHISVSHSSNLNLGDELSILLWVYPNTVSGNRALVYKREGYTGYWVRLENDYSLRAGTRSGDPADDPPHTITTNNWNHVVFNVNATAQQLYVNGAETGHIMMSGQIGVNSLMLAIGASNDDIDNFYKGIIDEVMIFNRSLSSEEIQEIYALDFS